MYQKGLTALALISSFALGCGSEYAPYTAPQDDVIENLGSREAAVAACEGDDLQYDFNAFAASLAVAIANEMGRWDVLADFEIRNGKLELSQTGQLRCGAAGCNNIQALLRLQDDSSAGVPYHSPSIYRSKLSGWYAAQKTKLVELATASTQSEGTYRVLSRLNNKRMTVDGGSLNDNARVEMWDWTPSAGADEWRLQVSGTKHKLINARSGKCLDLRMDSDMAGMELVQKTCSSSGSQLFELQNIDQNYTGIINRFGKAAEVRYWSSSNDTPVVTGNWQAYEANKAWRLEPIGGGATSQNDQNAVPNGMYSLIARHSGKAVGVEGGSLLNGAAAAQRSYGSGSDSFHWYVSKVGQRYQFINRRSGMCLALLTNSWSSEDMGQRPCANVDTQMFSFEKINNGEEHFGIRGPNGKILMIEDYGLTEGASLVLRAGNPNDEWSRQFRLNDILAGEPHELTFSHSTEDGPCGDYYWYEITQPNGLPLTAPQESFVQLMFAGGKSTLAGQDENPFIAQQVNGTLVAIDPSGFMNIRSKHESGSCLATDILYDPTRLAVGGCCLRFNGDYGLFQQSSWSTSTFLCK